MSVIKSMSSREAADILRPLATESVIAHGYRIAYNVLGSLEGQPVILIHGTPSSSLIWRNIAPTLTAAGYKVHLYDLLGYGQSERPWDRSVDTSISGQIPVLESLIEHWNLTTEKAKFHVVAHDIGGAVAQRFCILSALSGHVQSLTLIDSVSFDSYPSQRTKQMMQSGLDSLVLAADAEHRAHFREWLTSAVKDTEKFEQTALYTYLEYISGPIGQASLFQHQIRHYDPKHTMELAGRYHELGKIPVKLIWGAQDAWQVISWAEKLKDAIPGSTLDVVEDAGHFSPEDQPERISELLLQHMRAI